MTGNDYQKQALKTAFYPEKYRIIYPALGLAGEVGETIEKIKKAIRDTDFDPSYYQVTQIDSCPFHEKLRENVKLELSDICWYLATLSNDFGLKLDDIFQANIDKLTDRANRGVLSGSGDNR